MATDDQKNSDAKPSIEQKIDLSIKMYNAALESCKTRQVYEWKFCILVWTAIGGLIGILLVNKLTLDRQASPPWILIVLSALIWFIVAYFQKWCNLSNQVDKRRGEMYENVINKHLDTIEDAEAEFIDRYDEAVKLVRPKKGKWSRNSQIAVTALLLITFNLIYLAIPSSKSPGQTQLLEVPKQGVGWVVLDWKAPADGGKPSAYKVQRRSTGGGSGTETVRDRWEDVATAILTEATLVDQPRGVQLEYRVIAINKAGEGPPSNTVTAIL